MVIKLREVKLGLLEFASILYVQICRRFCYLVAGSCCSSYQECGRNELRRHRESNQCSRRKGECVEILRFQRINKENTFMSTSDLGDDTQRLVSCVFWTRNFAESSLRKTAAALRHVAMVENFWISTNPWSCNGRKKRHVWLSCAWLLSGTTRQPILSTIVGRCWCPFVHTNVTATLVTWRHTSPLYCPDA